MNRIPDVLDTWFDSGSMPYAQQHYPFENKEKFENSFPAEFIAEGIDQTRAWFYYLHMIAVGVKNSLAFKNVIVNGMVLAEDGKKMSKSLDNFSDPMDMINKYGADALRIYLLTSPVVSAENFSFIEKDMKSTYRRFTVILQNIFNFYEIFKGDNIFNGEKSPISNNILDKWIISELNILIKIVDNSMREYNLLKSTNRLDDLWEMERMLSRWEKMKIDSDNRTLIEEPKIFDAARNLSYILKSRSI